MAMIIATALVISGQDLMSTKAYIRDLLEVFDIEPE